jgi:hypothetical protein
MAIEESEMTETVKSPIKSGWRGNINGAVELCDNTEVRCETVRLTLGTDAAWALCNVLHDKVIRDAFMQQWLEAPQIEALSMLGAALGRLIDHSSSNNGGREILK